MNKNWGKKTFSVLMTLLLACSLMTGVFAAQPESALVEPPESSSSEAGAAAPEDSSVPEPAPESASSSTAEESAPSSSQPEESSSAVSEAPASSEVTLEPIAPEVPDEMVPQEEDVAPQRAPALQDIITVNTLEVKIRGTVVNDGDTVTLPTGDSSFSMESEWSMNTDPNSSTKPFPADGLIVDDWSYLGRLSVNLPFSEDLESYSMDARIDISNPDGTSREVNIGKVTFTKNVPDANYYGIKLTYNENAAQLTGLAGVEGRLWLAGTLTVTEANAPGDKFEFDAGGSSITIQVFETPEIEKKSLGWDGSAKPFSISKLKANWQVDINPNGMTIKDGKITDYLKNPTGSSTDWGRHMFHATDYKNMVNLYPLTLPAGTVGKAISKSDYSIDLVDAQTLQITLGSSLAWDVPYRLEVVSVADPSAKAPYPSSTSLKWTNGASYQVDRIVNGVSETVTVKDSASTVNTNKWGAEKRGAVKKISDGGYKLPSDSGAPSGTAYYVEWTAYLNNAAMDYGTVTVMDSLKTKAQYSKSANNLFLEHSNPSKNLLAIELYKADSNGNPTSGNLMKPDGSLTANMNPTDTLFTGSAYSGHFSIPNVKMDSRLKLVVRTFYTGNQNESTALENRAGWMDAEGETYYAQGNVGYSAPGAGHTTTKPTMEKLNTTSDEDKAANKLDWTIVYNPNDFSGKVNSLVFEDVFGSESYWDSNWNSAPQLKDPEAFPDGITLELLRDKDFKVGVGPNEKAAFAAGNTKYKLEPRTLKTGGKDNGYKTGFKLTITSPIPVNNKVYIRYKTKYSIASPHGAFTFRNFVRSVSELQGESTVHYQYAHRPLDITRVEPSIQKTGDLYFNGPQAYVDWTVLANSNGDDLGKNVRVIDLLGTSYYRSMKRDEAISNMKVYAMESGGARELSPADYTVKAGNPDFSTSTDKNNNSFYVDFKINVNVPIKMVFTTAVDINKLPTSKKVENEAAIGWVGKTCTVKARAEVPLDKYQDLVVKKLESLGNGLYKWTVTVDAAQAPKDMTNIVMTDVISRGHYYVNGSYTLEAETPGGAARKAELEKLEPGYPDYFVNSVEPHWNSSLTFKMASSVILKKADGEKLIFTYQTRVDESQLIKDQSGKYTISNMAVIKADGIVNYTTERETTKAMTGGVSGFGKKINLIIEKLDKDTGLPLADVEFRIYKMNNLGKLVPMSLPANFKSDPTTGLTPCVSLETGTYYVEESVPPLGYDADDNVQAYELAAGGSVKARKITLTNADGLTAITDYNGTVVKEPGGTKDLYGKKVTFKNQKRRHKVVVEKVDSSTGLPLDGASFQLLFDKNTDGAFDDSDPDEDLGTKVTASGGKAEWTQLEDGDYKLVEVSAPTGYTMTARKEETFTLKTTGGVVEEKVFTNWKNDPVLHSAAVVKTDADTGAALVGATFELTNTTTGESLGKKVTEDKGVATWTGLAAGSYKLAEISAPDGYQLPTGAAAEKTFTIARGNTATTKSITWTNTKIKTPVLSTYLIEVLKTDAVTGQALPGATFELFKEGVSLGSIVTNASGKALWTALEEGNYKVVETAAPAGYKTPTGADAERSVTLNASTPQSAQRIIWPNTPENKTETKPEPKPDLYSVEVLKVDSKSSKKLSGASFRLLDSNGASKDRKTTGSNGKAKWTDLEAGTYTLEELRAPKGYDLPRKTKTTVRVPARGSNSAVVKVTVKNTKTPSSSSTAPSPSSPNPSPNPAPASPTPPPAAATTPRTPTAPATPPDTDVADDTTPDSTPPAATVASTSAATPPDEDTSAGADSGASVSLADQVVQDTDVPLSGFGGAKAWSLLNLMMSIVSIFAAIALIITAVLRRRREEQNDYENEYAEDEVPQQEESADRKRLMGLRIPAILTGFLPGILFLILEDIRLPMTWITRWTPIIGVFFIINMVFVITHFIIKKRVDQQEKGEDTGNTGDTDDADVAYS